MITTTLRKPLLVSNYLTPQYWIHVIVGLSKPTERPALSDRDDQCSFMDYKKQTTVM